MSNIDAKLYRMSSWHPLLATWEERPGLWEIRTPDGEPYGCVEIRRSGTHVFYRCWYGEVELHPVTTLRAATMSVHRAYISTLSPGPPPSGIYPNLMGIIIAPSAGGS